MYRKLIFIYLFLFFISCSQPSTNLVYFHDIGYKHLFTYNGSLYGHVLYVKNRKTNKAPNQKELEEFTIYYSIEQNKKESTKKIDYVKFISEEFAQKDEIDEYHIATIYLQYKSDEPKIKQFYQDQ